MHKKLSPRARLQTERTPWRGHLCLRHLEVGFSIAPQMSRAKAFVTALFQKLNILDRLLTPAILVFMILGVIIGEFAPHVQEAFDTARFDSVSVR
jgi:ACR3 family arsenite transporter